MSSNDVSRYDAFQKAVLDKIAFTSDGESSRIVNKNVFLNLPGFTEEEADAALNYFIQNGMIDLPKEGLSSDYTLTESFLIKRII